MVNHQVDNELQIENEENNMQLNIISLISGAVFLFICVKLCPKNLHTSYPSRDLL